MKSFPGLFLAAFLGACAAVGTAPPQAGPVPMQNGEPQAAARQRVLDVQFPESSGTVNLAFDETGQWVKITAVGTADILDESRDARETALMIASLRAKRAIVQFLTNEIKASKSLARIAGAYSKASTRSENQSTGRVVAGEDPDGWDAMAPERDGSAAPSEQAQQARRLANSLTERISENTSAILRGAYLSGRTFRDDRVTVEITASRASIEAARDLHRHMGGVMQ